MDVHPPIGPVHSLKDILIHVGIVTLGIVIALGGEQLVEAHHRKTLEQHAVDAFRKEIQRDIESIRSVPSNLAKIRVKIDAAQSLVEHAGSGATTQKIDYPLAIYQLTYNASWDAAIATQAIGNMPYDDVQKYALAFAEMKVVETQEREGLRLWESVKRFGDDPATMTPAQRTELVEQLRSYRSFTEMLEAIAKDALENGQSALD